MHVVFEDCWLVDCWKIAAHADAVSLQKSSPTRASNAVNSPLLWTSQATLGTHPLVKTFSKEVLPQAPSPLMCDCPSSANCPCDESLPLFSQRIHSQQHELALDGFAST